MRREGEIEEEEEDEEEKEKKKTHQGCEFREFSGGKEPETAHKICGGEITPDFWDRGPHEPEWIGICFR